MNRSEQAKSRTLAQYLMTAVVNMQPLSVSLFLFLLPVFGICASSEDALSTAIWNHKTALQILERMKAESATSSAGLMNSRNCSSTQSGNSTTTEQKEIFLSATVKETIVLEKSARLLVLRRSAARVPSVVVVGKERNSFHVLNPDNGRVLGSWDGTRLALPPKEQEEDARTSRSSRQVFTSNATCSSEDRSAPAGSCENSFNKDELGITADELRIIQAEILPADDVETALPVAEPLPRRLWPAGPFDVTGSQNEDKLLAYETVDGSIVIVPVLVSVKLPVEQLVVRFGTAQIVPTKKDLFGIKHAISSSGSEPHFAPSVPPRRSHRSRLGRRLNLTDYLLQLEKENQSGGAVGLEKCSSSFDAGGALVQLESRSNCTNGNEVGFLQNTINAESTQEIRFSQDSRFLFTGLRAAISPARNTSQFVPGALRIQNRRDGAIVQDVRLFPESVFKIETPPGSNAIFYTKHQVGLYGSFATEWQAKPCNLPAGAISTVAAHSDGTRVFVGFENTTRIAVLRLREKVSSPDDHQTVGTTARRNMFQDRTCAVVEQFTFAPQQAQLHASFSRRNTGDRRSKLLFPATIPGYSITSMVHLPTNRRVVVAATNTGEIFALCLISRETIPLFSLATSDLLYNSEENEGRPKDAAWSSTSQQREISKPVSALSKVEVQLLYDRKVPPFLGAHVKTSARSLLLQFPIAVLRDTVFRHCVLGDGGSNIARNVSRKPPGYVSWWTHFGNYPRVAILFWTLLAVLVRHAWRYDPKKGGAQESEKKEERGFGEEEFFGNGRTGASASLRAQNSSRGNILQEEPNREEAGVNKRYPQINDPAALNAFLKKFSEGNAAAPFGDFIEEDGKGKSSASRTTAG
ncbi:unnamed protein product, partial [Amoebophrya sp. A120]|eukprot:GSA120T00013030001.1